MKSTTLVMTFAAVFIMAEPAISQTDSSNINFAQLAKEIAPARQHARLTVQSSAFAGGDVIPERHVKDGGNMSPPLQWSRGPKGTRSYAVIAEDIVTSDGKPDIHTHWIVYDIGFAYTSLESDLAKAPTVAIGANQAKNLEGSTGYSGPNPVAGRNGAYHFQVFALNTNSLGLNPGEADREKVIAAIKGKVLASGDLIGRYTGK